MSSLAVLHASQLITLAGPPRARSGKELGELKIIPDGGLFAADGKITRVGKTPEIKKFCQHDTEVVDARGCVVLPGFVDAHTISFLPEIGSRILSRAHAARLTNKLQSAAGESKQQCRRRAPPAEDDLFALAKKRAGWFLQNGTTTSKRSQAMDSRSRTSSKFFG
jgi:cytosine/adenosine deaminase-related metal-dependent hydrolase